MPRTFPQRLTQRERLEIGDHLCRAAIIDAQLEPLLSSPAPQLVETCHFHLCNVTVGQVVVRAPHATARAPTRVSATAPTGSVARHAVASSTARSNSCNVDMLIVDAKQISGSTELDVELRDPLPQAKHERLQRGGIDRRLDVPHQLTQAVHRDRPTTMQQQRTEQPPLTSAGQHDLRVVGARDPHRTEDAERQHAVTVANGASRPCGIIWLAGNGATSRHREKPAIVARIGSRGILSLSRELSPKFGYNECLDAEVAMSVDQVEHGAGDEFCGVPGMDDVSTDDFRPPRYR